MCTVSWLRQKDGYLLLCNRDERHTRKPASGPRIGALRGVSFVAPVDADQGGSWIGVNQFGLTLCLLNRYGDWTPQPDKTYTSRGLLLTNLLDCSDGAALQQKISAQSLEHFQPFTLAALALQEPAMLFEWTGSDFNIERDAESHMPLISSSLREPKIAQTRKELFSRMVADAGSVDAILLREFHGSHFPERGPLSVCMHRDDAATVSLSVIKVKLEAIEFTYYPNSPCLHTVAERVVIKRQRVN